MTHTQEPENRVDGKSHDWLLGWSTSSAMKSICFHHAGGNAHSFRSWAKSVDPRIQLLAANLPMSTANGKPYGDVFQLIDKMVDAVEPTLRSQPFALIGHSMGARLCFELARELRRRRGPAPRHIFVLAQAAPHLNCVPKLQHLDDHAFANAIDEHFGGIQQQLLQNSRLFRLFLPTLRAHFALIENSNYREEAPLDTDMTCMFGADDTLTEEDLRQWSRHVTGSFFIQKFPGGHFFLKQNENEILYLVNQRLTPDVSL